MCVHVSCCIMQDLCLTTSYSFVCQLCVRSVQMAYHYIWSLILPWHPKIPINSISIPNWLMASYHQSSTFIASGFRSSSARKVFLGIRLVISNRASTFGQALLLQMLSQQLAAPCINGLWQIWLFCFSKAWGKAGSSTFWRKSPCYLSKPCCRVEWWGKVKYRYWIGHPCTRKTARKKISLVLCEVWGSWIWKKEKDLNFCRWMGVQWHQPNHRLNIKLNSKNCVAWLLGEVH